MSLLGCRVVRGPDWKWEDQDGGEGCVGTIINLERFNDGSKLPEKTVLVCWDTGRNADYRAGLNGCYDLRTFDSASGGIKFSGFLCDECNIRRPIEGVRWHCLQCHDFDLCNVCYMDDKHSKDHAFERFHISNDRTHGTRVAPRSKSKKIRAKGLFPGAIVKPGRDWSLDLGLDECQGRVVGLTEWENVPRSAVKVQWGQEMTLDHRLGFEGKVDLKVENAVQNGPFYYVDHLVIVKADSEYKRFAVTDDNKLTEGDTVTIHLDADTLKQMSTPSHGGWINGMEKVIGKVGKVVKIDEDGDVKVSFGIFAEYFFHPDAIVKVRDLRPSDKVRVLNNKQLVSKYQDGHGGWNNSMEDALGKQGTVVSVDKDGDALVNVASQRWLFNPAALLLESKEEERGPAGDREGSGDADIGELVIQALLQGLVGAGHGIEQLVLASTLGDLGKVKEIIEKEPRLINQKSGSDKTALQVACHQGNPDIVSFLLEKGADKDIRDEGGYTALHHAAYGDKSGACVVTMLSANTNVNATDGSDKVTPLHLAIQQNNEKAVTALTLFPHCDLNLQDKAGDTPLHCTILLNQTQNTKTILTRLGDLDPTIVNEKGFNVLHLACLKNSIELADVLIDKYPGLVGIVKEDGFSTLHLAALNNRCEIAQSLILSGQCDINGQNNEGRTALSLAVGEGNKKIIDLLVEHQADANIGDKDGDTPLHMAIMKHCISFLGLGLTQILLGQNTPGESEKSNYSIVIFLIAKGRADVNCRNHSNKTPLDLCIDKRLQNLIEITTDSARRPPEAFQSPQGSSPHRTLPRPSLLSSKSNPATPTQTSLTHAPKRSQSHDPSVKKPPVAPKPPNRSSSPDISKMVKPPIPKRIYFPPTTVPVQATPSLPPKTLSHPIKNSSYVSDTALKLSELNISAERKKSAKPSGESVVPGCLSGEDDGQEFNENAGAQKNQKQSNNQLLSSIQSSSDQNELCNFCEENPACVILDPCQHKALCQACSCRAKRCPQCKAVIENRMGPPGEKTFTSLKRDYEDKVRKLDQLQGKFDEMERIAMCQICFERPSNVVFSKCGHKVCEKCSHRLRRCHLCNREISKEEKIITFQ